MACKLCDICSNQRKPSNKAYGLLEDDSEWNDAMKQASEWANPASLRELFVTLILLCEVTSPEILFENHQKSLGEDILFRYRKTNHNQSLQLSDDQIKNDTLCEIENIMVRRGKTLTDIEGFPKFNISSQASYGNKLIAEELDYNYLESTGVGYGGAASDHLGEVVLAFCGGSGRNYVLFQELEAIEKGLQGCQLHGFWRVEGEKTAKHSPHLRKGQKQRANEPSTEVTQVGDSKGEVSHQCKVCGKSFGFTNGVRKLHHYYLGDDNTAQCNARKAKESNLACQLQVQRRTDDHPLEIKVTFVNGVEQVFDAASTSTQSIREMILEKGQYLEKDLKFRVKVSKGAKRAGT
ncbi:hypothetical protein IFM89_026735 [Coptis chinensis]|uniref:Uncharacterized protein n=1 Tax=Coptis chinensis TaxID=261450 RepID=A0A835M493_9MAGN|nr:hypothetical protein IFM89_026735 [Coptis chinensis]